MTYEIEIETTLDSYVVVRGLLKQREQKKEYRSGAVESIDRVLEQFVGHSIGDALLSEWATEKDGYWTCPACGAVLSSAGEENHRSYSQDANAEKWSEPV